MRHLTNRKDIAFILTISWMVLIFYLSHQPASTSSKLSGSFVQVLFEIVSLFPIVIEGDTVHFIVRKSAHFMAYFILGILIMHTVRLFSRLSIFSIVNGFFITVLYAASDEFHQTFIPGRSGEIRDVLIDSAGSLTGILTYVVAVLLYNNRRQTSK